MKDDLNDLSGELHGVLDRASADIGAPALATRALDSARRRRARRRGAVAAVLSSTLVVAVVVASQLGRGPNVAPPTNPSLTTSPSPSPTDISAGPDAAPPVDPTRVQPLWDPDDVAELPLDPSVPPLDLLDPAGPAGVTSGTALAAADQEDLSWLWGADGGWRSSSYPEPGQRYVRRAIALTPDGAELVTTGRTALWTRGTDSQQWREVPYPSGFRTESDYSTTLAAYDDGRILLGQFRRYWLLDAEGAATRLPFDALDEVVPAGDDVLAERFAQPLTQVVEEWRDGEIVRSTDSSDLRSLQRPVADDSSIAVTRGYGGYSGGERGPVDNDGLLALDRDGLTTRAYLPTPSRATYYSDNGGLTAVGWLDGDTVLAEVRPRKDFDVTYLITWDVETGELRRAGSYVTATAVVFAIDAL